MMKKNELAFEIISIYFSDFEKKMFETCKLYLLAKNNFNTA